MLLLCGSVAEQDFCGGEAPFLWTFWAAEALGERQVAAADEFKVGQGGQVARIAICSSVRGGMPGNERMGAALSMMNRSLGRSKTHGSRFELEKISIGLFTRLPLFHDHKNSLSNGSHSPSFTVECYREMVVYLQV